VNVPRIKGNHNAMLSGIAAAEAAPPPSPQAARATS
jgi:flavin-dependent dehydrogenase